MAESAGRRRWQGWLLIALGLVLSAAGPLLHSYAGVPRLGDFVVRGLGIAAAIIGIRMLRGES